MDKPVVHQETWALVRRLAARWHAPEWKVMHLAVVSLERLAKDRPQIMDALRGIEGDIRPSPPDAHRRRPKRAGDDEH